MAGSKGNYSCINTKGKEKHLGLVWLTVYLKDPLKSINYWLVISEFRIWQIKTVWFYLLRILLVWRNETLKKDGRQMVKSLVTIFNKILKDRATLIQLEKIKMKSIYKGKGERKELNPIWTGLFWAPQTGLYLASGKSKKDEIWPKYHCTSII